MNNEPVFYPNPNPNGNKLVDCMSCGKRIEHHAKGLCYPCYKKQWQPEKIKCKNCGRVRPHHSFGLCNTCNTRLHHYDKVLAYNAKKNFRLDLATFKELTKECVVCGFNKIVELHHLDSDRNHNANENLIPLCPNCHKLIHTYLYYNEILDELKKKGYAVDKAVPRKLSRGD